MINVVRIHRYARPQDDVRFQISINDMLVGDMFSSEHEANIAMYWLISALDEIIDLHDRELI